MLDDDAFVAGECSMVDITFANNVSVIPSSPSQLRPTAILRERNLLQQQRSCRPRHVTVMLHLFGSSRVTCIWYGDGVSHTTEQNSALF